MVDAYLLLCFIAGLLALLGVAGLIVDAFFKGQR